MQSLKVFVCNDGTATIICPGCAKHRTIDATGIGASRRKLRVRCSCSCEFSIVLEGRRNYRKPDLIFGHYRKKDGDGRCFDMTVEDLSCGGLRFSSFRDHHLEKGDLVQVEFPLKNSRNDKVRALAEVRWVNGHIVGAEFVDLDPFTEKTLGFYLMP